MSKCCAVECNSSAEFRIEWANGPDDYTESCELHVGPLLGVHPGQAQPTHYRVYPILVSAEPADKAAATPTCPRCLGTDIKCVGENWDGINANFAYDCNLCSAKWEGP